MATAATIDLETLLAPISESAPTGTDLRLDLSPNSIYFKIKDARSGARAAERRADSEGGGVGFVTEWQTILTLVPKALKENSKDLEVTAWFTEALLRAHGFAGLRDGLRLMKGLFERYWDGFFSLQDEDGAATRFAPLAGLNGMGSEGTLIQPLRKVPVTAPGDDGPFPIYKYDEARALANVIDPVVVKRREEAGEINMERFLRAMNASGGIYYISMLDDLEACLAAVDELGGLLTERAGRDAPPTSDLHGVLTTIRDSVASFSEDLVTRARASAAQAASDSADTDATGDDVRHSAKSRLEGGRDEALRTLMQVAEYFRKYEPHSPISTSLDEIVRRAKMPFAELLAELLPDTASWRSALTSAGIKPPPEASV